MDNPILAHKVEKIIQVEAKKFDYVKNNIKDFIVVKAIESDDQKAKKEKEYKYKQEFEEYYYEYYLKRNHKLDEYTKKKLWISFKCKKISQENSIITKIKNFIEEFEDNYL